MEAIIKACFLEFGMPLEGTAYADAETPFMYESYQKENEVYYVIADEKSNEILGGAGIKPLKDFKGNVCELQKMYFSPKIRGLGYGKRLMQYCLDFAEEAGYGAVYLETFPSLTKAIAMYHSFGFKTLDSALGNTGHCACDIWMLKNLEK